MRRIASSIAGRGSVAAATRSMSSRASMVAPAAAQSLSKAGKNASSVSSPRSSRDHAPPTPVATTTRLMKPAGIPVSRS